MLHKLIDFTQTILGTVALTGIIAFSIITVNALNPSIKTSTSEEPKVEGISTLPRDSNTLPVQFTNSLRSAEFKGNLSYISDNKTTYKLEVQNLSEVQEIEVINVENLNHYSSSFNLSVYIPQEINEKVKVELVDNIDTYELNETPKVIQLDSLEQKTIKLKLTPKVNINFPFELEFAITQ